MTYDLIVKPFDLYDDTALLHVSLQIAWSLNRFGVNEATQHLLVARFDATGGDVGRGVGI